MLASSTCARASSHTTLAHGGSPRTPESPNAEGIRDSYLFVSIFVVAVFVLVEGLLIAFIWKVQAAEAGAVSRTVRRFTARRSSSSRGPQGPLVVLFLIAAFVFIELPGQGHPRCDRGRATARDQGDGPPVLLAVRVSERRRRDRPAARAGRRARASSSVTAPDSDVIHSLVDPGARRQDRRDPGQDERDVVRGRARRRLHGAVRRAVRARAREHARVGGRRARGRVRLRGSTQQRDEQNAASSSSARRSGRACAPSATASPARAASARGSPASPTLTDRERPREPRPQRQGRRCPRSAPAGRDEQVESLDRATSRRTRPVAVSAEPSQYPAWQRGRVDELARHDATTSGSGSCTSRRALVFFVLAGLMALAHAHAARAGERDASSAPSATTSSSRSTGRRWSSSSSCRSSPGSRTTSCR